MAFTTGTTRNQNGLLEAMQAWAVATLGWTQREYTAADQQAQLTGNLVAAGGSLYVPTDVVTLSGGTSTVATQITVDTVDGGGAILTFTVSTQGKYSVLPGNPVSTTGGTGSLATFTMIWERIPTEVATLSLEGPGAGVGKRTFVNIQTDNNVGNGEYAWEIFEATSWLTGIAFGSLPGAGGPSWLNLWENSIDYWLFGNDRHITVVAKVSTNYMSAYGGFLLPVGLPSEYPAPLYLGASYPSMARADFNNARNSSIADPGDSGAAWYRRRTSGVWTQVRNQGSSTSSVSPVTGERAFVWPHKTGQGSGSFIDNPNNWNSAGMGQMKLNANGEAPLFQCHVIDMQDRVIVGALEGVFSTTGFGRSVEQLITIGGRSFRLFQRAFRNTPGDFFAVEEV